MEPKLLSQLAYIVKFGSLSRAAEILEITQPALTRSIKLLESKIGGPVLIRASNGVRPTEIGAQLAELGDRINEQSEKSSQLIDIWKDGRKGVLNIGVGPALGLGAMDDFFSFADLNTGPVLHFSTGKGSSMINKLQHGELDIVLAPANLDVEHRNVKRQIIFNDQIRIFAGKKSPLFASKEKVTTAAMKQQPWAVSGASSGIYEALDLSRLTGPIKVMFTGSVDLVISLLQTSEILVALPYRFVMMSGKLSEDYVLSTDALLPRRDIALWSTEKNMERPEILITHELIKEYFRRLGESSIGNLAADADAT